VGVLRPGALVLLTVGLGLGSATAHANPASVVPTIGDGPNALLRVDYEYEVDTSNIDREHVGDPGADPLAPLTRQHDLVFHQYKHTVTPRLDVGVYHDTWLSVALPIIVTQARELRLGSGVDRSESPSVLSGYIPESGFDAHDPLTPPPGDLLFRGGERHGLNQLHVGIGVAPMNQRRDDTKPTWKLGVEGRFAVGKIMRFDRLDPSGETGVSEGVHELRLWTTVDRKLGWVEPWFEASWQVPIALRSGSLYQDPGFGSTNAMPGQLATAKFGVEIFVVDDKETRNKISLDLSTRIVGHFEGRGYSEMWEVFAFAGDQRIDGNPLVLDANPLDTGLQALSHPGITNIENYLETAAHLTLAADLGRVRFALNADIMWKTDHAITFADGGIDRNNNGIVDAGTNEVNPVYAAPIDLVGHRYLSDGNLGVAIGIEGQFLF